jgi:hypothetical protein
MSSPPCLNPRGCAQCQTTSSALGRLYPTPQASGRICSGNSRLRCVELYHYHDFTNRKLLRGNEPLSNRHQAHQLSAVISSEAAILAGGVRGRGCGLRPRSCGYKCGCRAARGKGQQVCAGFTRERLCFSKGSRMALEARGSHLGKGSMGRMYKNPHIKKRQGGACKRSRP